MHGADLAGATGDVLDRLAVAAVHDRWRKLGEALERLEVAAQRIEICVFPAADVRADRRKNHVAAEHAVGRQTMQRDVAIGMAGQVQDAEVLVPDTDEVALVDKVRRFGDRDGRTTLVICRLAGHLG